MKRSRRRLTWDSGAVGCNLTSSLWRCSSSSPCSLRAVWLQPMEVAAGHHLDDDSIRRNLPSRPLLSPSQMLLRRLLRQLLWQSHMPRKPAASRIGSSDSRRMKRLSASTPRHGQPFARAMSTRRPRCSFQLRPTASWCTCSTSIQCRRFSAIRSHRTSFSR